MTQPSHAASTNIVQTKQSAFYRTRLCKFSDQCPYGNRCFYAHSEDQIRGRSAHAGSLTCSKIDSSRLKSNAIPFVTLNRRQVTHQAFPSFGNTDECMKGNGPFIPTATTDLGESTEKSSCSDDQSSDAESPSRILPVDDFDATASERLETEIRCIPGFVFSTHPRHVAMLRAWYCYERTRGLLYSCRPETLYKILKEAEPVFYSD